MNSSSSSSKPKGITPQQRVKQIPDENLVVSCNKLFCEEVVRKKLYVV